MPALEALASGTPLVTTSGSALEEVVGDAALLVPPADPDSLARALATVLDDAPVAARLRAAGPARAATFTWARSIDAHVEAYLRAIGHRATGRGGLGTAVPG
jgi:glycosyltransferase involved in cell wall biosynthesis